MWAPESQHYNRIFYLIFTMGALISIFTYSDYGITWDQAAQYDYGLAVYNYYATFFSDKTALTLGPNLFLYGGFVDFWSTALNKIFSWIPPFEFRALYSSIWGLIGWFYFYKWVRYLSQPQMALIGSLIFLLTPSLWGHAFINSKDIPFACAFLASFYYLTKILNTDSAKNLLWLKFSISLGITLGIRIGGALLVFYLLTFISLKKLYFEKAGLKSLPWKPMILCLLGSYIIMLVFWPWAQQNPLLNPITALFKISQFNWSGKVLFMGEMIPGKDVPFYYLPVYFGVKLPVIYHLGLLAFVIILFKKSEVSENFSRLKVYLLTATLFPFFYVMINGSTLYDGIRHFLFIIPFLALLTVVGIVTLINQIDHKKN